MVTLQSTRSCVSLVAVADSLIVTDRRGGAARRTSAPTAPKRHVTTEVIQRRDDLASTTTNGADVRGRSEGRRTHELKVPTSDERARGLMVRSRSGLADHPLLRGDGGHCDPEALGPIDRFALRVAGVFVPKPFRRHGANPQGCPGHGRSREHD